MIYTETLLNLDCVLTAERVLEPHFENKLNFIFLRIGTNIL